MSADGTWKIVVQTPLGTQEVTARIVTDGGTFTAATEGAMGSQQVSGQVLGDTLTWTAKITNPMPLTIDFEATVAGDSMRGTAKLGLFGDAPLTGERI
jgi:hypothetical protein